MPHPTRSGRDEERYTDGVKLRSLVMDSLVITLGVTSVACQPSTSPPPPQAQYPQQQQAYPYGPGQPPPQPYPTPGAPPSTPPPVQPPAQATRPLLAPLAGAAAWQAEVRAVLAELMATLSADKQQKVRGIPLVFDPDTNEVNAYAGCDEQGAPFLAATEGLLEAVDAMAQTKATDEQFQTQTYEAYTAYAAPRLVSGDKKNGSPALVGGIIPPQYWGDARRLSRAHEIFDEVVGFTFGHELSHHYLGHTGCANGQGGGSGPNPAQIGHLFIRILPGLNQPNEALADINGTINTLDTGRARAQSGLYRWTEAGGLTLLDFFARMERAAGISPLNPVGFLRTHPNPAIRIPVVQTTASTWRQQHPG